jgi:TM2 domain-containing membrane protein YozV
MEENINIVINNQYSNNISLKKKWVAFILLFIGLHRFYVGKIFTGILFLATAGLGGIWLVIDGLSILFGNFKDNCGLSLK